MDELNEYGVILTGKTGVLEEEPVPAPICIRKFPG